MKPGVACATRARILCRLSTARCVLHPAFTGQTIKASALPEGKARPRSIAWIPGPDCILFASAWSPTRRLRRLSRTFELESSAFAATVSSTAPPPTDRGSVADGLPLGCPLRGAPCHGPRAAPAGTTSRQSDYRGAGRLSTARRPRPQWLPRGSATVGASGAVTRTAPATVRLSACRCGFLLLAVSGLQPPWNDAPYSASPRLPAGG